MEQEKRLNLMIANTKELEPGLTPSRVFSEEGGVIGSNVSAYWVLQDPRKDVYGAHCEVLIYDNHFCIKDLCGETYVNGASMPVGIGKMVQITSKDTLKVGVYELIVASGTNQELIQAQSQSLDQLFTEGSVLVDGQPSSKEAAPIKSDIQYIDPLDVLDGGDISQQDGRLFAQTEEKRSEDQLETERLLADEIAETEDKPTFQADSEYEISSAIKLKKKHRFNPFSFFSSSSVLEDTGKNQTDNCQLRSNTLVQSSLQGADIEKDIKHEGQMMDDKILDLLEEEMAEKELTESDIPMNEESNHLLSGPLFRGLSVSLSSTHQSHDVQMTSEEIGAALQAAIKGLLDLHQQVISSRYEVINKNLQPIEDNPLRLGLSYEDTVKTLFSTDVSVVRLSAPSAISESLKNLKDHNDVVQIATTIALGEIVRAFSPDVLMKRFENYRRSYQTPELNADAWAWNMYQNYYQELSSDRQQGFEKLFWEIFEQAYDRLLREKQLES